MTARSLGVLGTLALTTAVAAQSTAFTYQGRLKNGAAPAAGVHDFRFTLFNAALGGVQAGTSQCADNIGVSEGAFTATIDFGQQFASTEPRFLQIEVRADTGLGCGNPAGFVTLAPRQPINPAPAASHAHAAFALDAPDGTPANAVFVDNDGKVGIGTTTPQATLDVRTAGQGVRIQGGSAGVNNTAYVTFANGAGTDLGYIGDGSSGDSNLYVTSYANDVYLYTAAGAALTARSSGNVGIGTVTPANRLSVAGSADVMGNLGIGTAAPLAPLEVRGNIRLGSNGQLFAASGVSNLQIIHGRVGVGFFPQFGPGYRVERTGEGIYQITFLTPFSDLPSIAAMPMSQIGVGGDRLLYDDLAAGGVEVRALRGSALEDTIFTFIATGPR
jgi:hypothetical protein